MANKESRISYSLSRNQMTNNHYEPKPKYFIIYKLHASFADSFLYVYYLYF